MTTSTAAGQVDNIGTGPAWVAGNARLRAGISSRSGPRCRNDLSAGVNYYPHTARLSLSKVLIKTARRYRLPILVA